MGRRTQAAAALLLVHLAGAQVAWSQPTIPKDRVPPPGIPPEVRQQILKLYSDHPREKNSAIGALARMGPKAEPAIPFLVSMLEDRSAEEVLLASLHIRKIHVAAQAAGALAYLKRPAVEPLLAVLKDDRTSAWARTHAVSALGRISDKRTAAPLIAALKDKDAGVRAAAARGLELMKDKRALKPLIAALKDPDPSVQAAAANTLGRMRSAAEAVKEAVKPLAAALESKDQKVRWAAAGALAAIGKPAVESLIAALKHDDGTVRMIAAKALTEAREPRAAKGLTAVLKDANLQTREYAAEGLRHTATTAEMKAIIAALGDEAWSVRWRLIAALVRIGKPAVEPVIAVIKHDNANVRASAVLALRQLGDPRAIGPLIAALKDPEHKVRLEATLALGHLKDKKATGPLIQALKDEHWNVRAHAARGLGWLGDPRGLKPLVAALKDADFNVRGCAAEGLGLLGLGDAIAPLTKHALADPHWAVRMRGAWALGRLKDPRAVEALLGLLADANLRVTNQAIDALKEITGQHFGTDQAKWREWLKRQKTGK